MSACYRDGEIFTADTSVGQVLGLPVLSQFHNDVSSCGEDYEGHS